MFLTSATEFGGLDLGAILTSVVWDSEHLNRSCLSWAVQQVLPLPLTYRRNLCGAPVSLSFPLLENGAFFNTYYIA